MPRVHPKPFKKPSIDLGSPKHGRSWQDVPWWILLPGDTVADRGTLQQIIEPTGKNELWTYKFPERSTSMTREQAMTEKVFAFVSVNG